MNQIDFKNDLNEEQYAAVTAPDGPVLVIAAAGTGKTRTLTYRVAYLVNRDIESGRILLLTFTNRAAREMMERAEALVGGSVGGLWGGTFHHLANRILRQHAGQLGYQLDYTILDQDDARMLVRTCADELKLLGKEFPKPDVLLSVFSLAMNKEEPVEEIANQRFKTSTVDVGDVIKVYNAYVKRKESLSAMDFDDLLVNGLKLFRQHRDIRERYQDRFMHIMVDEYQDTNTIQAAWVDLLAEARKNLLVVGDDFQSIYSWRGADFRNILTFPDRYPGTTVFKLETNYRSVPEILRVANACIAGNPEQFQKEMKAVRENHRPPIMVMVPDGDSQAHYVIQKSAELAREGYKLSDMTVLYRAHFHALELQLELARERIPYVITSGVRFFEQAHIKDVCCVIRLLGNPTDELAFIRLMSLFPRVGKKTALKVWDQLGQRMNFLDKQERIRLTSLLPAAARSAWGDVETIFEQFEEDGLLERPGEIMLRFVHCFYNEFAVKTYENYDRRLEDIEGAAIFATRYESVKDFLNEVALLTNLEAVKDDEQEGEAIRLSTVHQAKGLEWSVVFVIWMVEGMFPSSRSLNEADAESEERRLFYVASTRAKDELMLCVPSSRRGWDGGVSFCSMSRFVTEIPEEFLEYESFEGARSYF